MEIAPYKSKFGFLTLLQKLACGDIYRTRRIFISPSPSTG